MKRFITNSVVILVSAVFVLTSPVEAANWLRSGTTLTEQDSTSPWVLNISVSNGEITVNKVTTEGANRELDFSGTIQDEGGTAYTIVSLDGFSGKSITKVTFPTGLRKLGRDAFAGCTALTTVEPFLPETLTELGQRAFAGCTSLTGDVIFPSGPVSSPYYWGNFTQWGWFNSTKITSCDMSAATLTEIPSGAFNACPSLKIVKLPQGLKTIGSNAFSNSTALETIEPLFPDTITSFAPAAFMNCSSLQGDIKLTNLSETVTFTHHNNNSYGTFQGCSSIRSFEMTATLNHNQYGLGAVDSNMFSGCSQLGDVTLPKGAYLKYDRIFYGCNALTNLTFLGRTAPTEFNTSAFDNLPNNKVRLYYPRLSASWETLIPTLKNYEPMTPQLESTFRAQYPDDEVVPLGRFKLNSVYVWISDLKSVDANAVYVLGNPVEANSETTPVSPGYGGHELTDNNTLTVSAPETAVYSGGEYTCRGYELSYETTPRSWSEPIQRSEQTCTITQDNSKVWRLTWLWDVASFTLTTDPVTPGGSALCNPPNTGSYSPETSVTITAHADEGYRFISWTGADAPTGENATNPTITIVMNATKEVRPLFARTSWLYDGNKTVTDGNWSLTVSRNGTSLSVTAATAIRDIGDLDFSRAIQDSSGTDYTLVSLDGFANKSISSLVLPTGLERIAIGAFSGCRSLKTVTPFLPETLTEFGQRAFAECVALEGDVVFPANTITSPYSWANAAWGWFNSTQITSCDMSAATLAQIPDYSFFNCKSLRWVKLPQGLTSIGENAFYGATMLETVEPLFPDTITYFGQAAFLNCSALKGDIKLTNSSAVVSFRHHNNNSYGTFQGCKNLTSFDMTAQIDRNVGERGAMLVNFLNGCVNLTDVSLPENLSKVNGSAFANCSALTNVYLRGSVPEIASNAFSGGPNGVVRFFVPKDDLSWTQDFYTAKVTPLTETRAAEYRALYPSGKLPKGDFNAFARRMWFMTWDPHQRPGMYIILR